MEHKEAIEIVKKNYPHVGFSGSQFETALRVLVPELAESEDEKIINALIRHLIVAEKNTISINCVPISNIIAYLEKQKDNKFAPRVLPCSVAWFEDGEEKQKEQKPIPKFKVGDCIYDKRDSYNRNVIREVGKDYYINAFAQKMDMAYTDANFEFLEHLDNETPASKPEEWSEEDENRIKSIKATLEQFAYTNNMLDVNGDCCDASMIKNINWLKSFRPQPHWKPSEEQIGALERAIIKMHTPTDIDILAELRDNLKKL